MSDVALPVPRAGRSTRAAGAGKASVPQDQGGNVRDGNACLSPNVTFWDRRFVAHGKRDLSNGPDTATTPTQYQVELTGVADRGADQSHGHSTLARTDDSQFDPPPRPRSRRRRPIIGAPEERSGRQCA